MGNEKNYLSYLDIAKGIAIFFVVAGHSFVPEIRNGDAVFGTLFHWIYSFHMPLFAIISGYLFEKSYARYREKGFSVFSLQKLKSLMVPYFSISIISYIIFAIVFLFPPLANILNQGGTHAPALPGAIFEILFCQDNQDKHMWFAYALFITLIISFIFGVLLRHPAGMLIALALFTLTYYVSFPDIIYKVFYLLIFFTFGRFVRLIDRLIEKMYFFPLLAAHIAFYLLRFSGILVPFQPLDAADAVLTGITGSLVFLSLAKNYLQNFKCRLLKLMGRESFSIYLLHQPFIVSGLCGVLLSMTPLPYIVICIISTAAGIVIPIFLSRAIIDRISILRMLMLGKFPVKNRQDTGVK